LGVREAIKYTQNHWIYLYHTGRKKTIEKEKAPKIRGLMLLLHVSGL
jgi:hypothetical protein